MYSREIKDCPTKFVRHARPVFGTFKGHPERLDIRGIFKPYGVVPLPVFITNLRIKSRISYYFNIGEYIGSIKFFDVKIMGLVEVCFWNKTTNQRYRYRSVMGPRKRFVPHKLNLAATSCYKKKRYIRISWDRKRDKLSVIFDLRGDGIKPNANAALTSKFSSSPNTELTTVVPAPTHRRSSASYQTSLPLHGAISLFSPDGEQKTMQDAEGLMFLDVNRTYMKFRSYGKTVTALGEVDGKQIALRLFVTSQDAVDSDKYNSNVLFYDSEVTPLPPVVITNPYGKMNKWIIQDTENMVDLTFSPVSNNVNKASIFVLRLDYETFYGTFEGMVCTARGKKINLKALQGLTEKYVIRL